MVSRTRQVRGRSPAGTGRFSRPSAPSLVLHELRLGVRRLFEEVLQFLELHLQLRLGSSFSPFAGTEELLLKPRDLRAKNRVLFRGGGSSSASMDAVCGTGILHPQNGYVFKKNLPPSVFSFIPRAPGAVLEIDAREKHGQRFRFKGKPAPAVVEAGQRKRPLRGAWRSPTRPCHPSAAFFHAGPSPC